MDIAPKQLGNLVIVDLSFTEYAALLFILYYGDPSNGDGSLGDVNAVNRL